MPYIAPERREALSTIANELPQNAGELNFVLFRSALDYIETKGGVNYQVLNDIVGALDGAKAELQRRVVAPYEDIKIRENGDIR